MAVTIDIPGIGSVEAKNAASESTLRELLKAMQGVEKKITGKKSGKAGGDNEDEPNNKPVDQFKAKLNESIKPLGAALGKVYAFGDAMSSLTNIIGNFANVGDSLERAAQQIPIFGGMLGTVAAAAVRANDAFLSAARSGAGFGDDLNEFARSASAAGMTLDKFGAFISSNSEGLIGLGGTVGQGVDNFTRISKQIRATGSDLFALGYSTEDINKGIANFGSLLRIQGRQGTMNNEQLAAASKNYMKEIDALAKATGEERSSIEAKMKQMAQDAQFSSFMSTKSVDVQNSFNSLITRMGPTLGNFAKDFITTGSLTSEQTQKIGAMYGQEALAELQRLRNLALANQKATAADSDRAVGVMIDSSKRVQQQFGQVIAQSGGAMNEVAMANVDANKMQRDAMVGATDEQKKAAAEGKKFNEKLQQSQATLAKFSNDFTIALANSGLLDFLMKAFGVMATLVQTFVVPAFQVLGTLLPGIATALGIYLTAVLANTAAKLYNTTATNKEAMAKMLTLTPLMKFALIAGVLVTAFKALYDSGWTLSTVYEAIVDNLQNFALTYVDIWLSIAEKIAKFFGKGDAITAAREKIKEEKAELKEKERARDEKRKLAREERNHDTKNLDEKKRTAAEEARIKLDTNAGPEALLKQFAKAEGSPLIPKDKKEAPSVAEGVPMIPKDKKEVAVKAETTKKEIEQKGEEKTAALKKAAEEQAKAEEKSKENSKKESPPKPATQESAESLLASLNTKMAELIKINKGTQAVSEQQLSVQKGMTSDLFAA
jgi:hypothetical protein